MADEMRFTIILVVFDLIFCILFIVDLLAPGHINIGIAFVLKVFIARGRHVRFAIPSSFPLHLVFLQLPQFIVFFSSLLEQVLNLHLLLLSIFGGFDYDAASLKIFEAFGSLLRRLLTGARLERHLQVALRHAPFG